MTYTVRYANTTSNVTLGQVVLTDIFTPNAYIDFLGTGWTQASPGIYTRTLSDLAPGASGSLLVPIQINAGLPANFLSISNTARLDAVPTLRATQTNPGHRISTDIDIVHGPDIAVTGMTYTPGRLRQYGPITIVVTYQNQGLDPTSGPDGKGWFGTDLYVKPSGALPPLDLGDHTDGTCPSPSGSCKYVKAFSGAELAAGEIFTVTYTVILKRGGAQSLYVLADPYWNVPGSGTLYGTLANGRILEGDETNNLFGPIEIYAQPAVFLPVIRRN